MIQERVAAVAEQVDEERLVGLLLAVTVYHDRDGFRGLAGGERQRAGLGGIVVVAALGGAVGRLVRHGYGLVVGVRERYGEGKQGLPAAAFVSGNTVDANSRLVVDD